MWGGGGGVWGCGGVYLPDIFDSLNYYIKEGGAIRGLSGGAASLPPTNEIAGR